MADSVLSQCDELSRRHSCLTQKVCFSHSANLPQTARGDEMERTERLLDLVALLLDAREPITWAELREAFPEDYGAPSDEAAERKFERDKAELLELGIPVTYIQGDDERRDGYVVDREEYYLPEVGLTPEELALLYAAGSAALASAAFPGRRDLAHALRKIGFYAGTELPSPRVRMELDAVARQEEIAPHLELFPLAAPRHRAPCGREGWAARCRRRSRSSSARARGPAAPEMPRTREPPSLPRRVEPAPQE